MLHQLSVEKCEFTSRTNTFGKIIIIIIFLVNKKNSPLYQCGKRGFKALLVKYFQGGFECDNKMENNNAPFTTDQKIL